MRVNVPRVRVRVQIPRPRVGGQSAPVVAGFRRGRLQLTGRESLLVLAPHCDDETLGAGALLADATKLGCCVKVAIITNGDGFRYAAGRHYKRLRLSHSKQVEFAYVRQRESRQALAELGVGTDQIAFLGYPDKGLQAMWKDAWDPEHCYRSPFTGASASPYDNSFTPNAPYCGRAVVDDVRRLLQTECPTHLVVPHPRDAHGDHTATFCFAIHALEELRAEGMDRPIQILCYLVHRGTWPYPRGFQPNLELQPPATFAELAERWVYFWPSPASVTAKHQALLRYRSQMSLLARFLLSFVRQTEVFSLYAPQVVRSVSEGTVVIDGSATEWPPGVGYLPDPVKDTVTRNVGRGADVSSIAVCADSGYLYLRFAMHGRVLDEVSCFVWLAACGRDRKKVHLRLVVPDRVLMRQDGKWVPTEKVVCRASGRIIETAIPRELIGDSDRIIAGAQTRYRQIPVDHTAWELLVLPPSGDAVPFMYATASSRDLLRVAAVFAAAFSDEIRQVLRTEPQLEMLIQVFEMLYEAEPQALFVARGAGGVVGYVFAPTSLRNVWSTALTRGHLWRWFTRWVRGQYRIGLPALGVLLLDKYFFAYSALRNTDRIQHRILSLGVLPEARGCGIATNLVQQALHRFERLGVRRVRLEVRPENTAALRVYEKLGFAVRSSTRDTRGEWLVMVKELGGASGT